MAKNFVPHSGEASPTFGHRPYKESISKEMKNDNDLYLHLHDQITEYKYTEDYLKRKKIEKHVRCFVDWPPCS